MGPLSFKAYLETINSKRDMFHDAVGQAFGDWEQHIVEKKKGVLITVSKGVDQIDIEMRQEPARVSIQSTPASPEAEERLSRLRHLLRQHRLRLEP